MQKLLALDAGTTGVTALLYDEQMTVLGRAYAEFAQHFPRPGWVEHDAADILGAVDQVIAELLGQTDAQQIAAIGITNQRETVFAIDVKTGAVLGRGIVWQDRRTAARCEELRAGEHAELIRNRTGLVIDPYFSATKIEWRLNEDDELRERAQRGEVRFCTVDTLLIHHLTAGESFKTDPTNASRTMLFDIEREVWDEELCEVFGIDSAWLPEVCPSIADFGTTAASVIGAAIPIRGVAGDQQAALFGQGCFESGDLKCTFGTGCFLLLNTGDRCVRSTQGLLTTLAVARDGSTCFAVEGSVFVAGAAIQWLRDGLGLIESAAESETLARSVPSSDGVFLVPAFTGLGAPYWDAEARGAILGISRGTERGHIARAALEAIAFQNAELIEILRDESGLSIDLLLADGGGAANDLTMQLQADFAQLVVARKKEVEATARGAAMLAGIGIGLITDLDSIANGQGASQRFEAELDSPMADERLKGWRASIERVRS
ncbi:MAG: glycerol kinase [Planctomycetota bacterium]|jgi:glycerol kinase